MIVQRSVRYNTIRLLRGGLVSIRIPQGKSRKIAAESRFSHSNVWMSNLYFWLIFKGTSEREKLATFA